MYDLLKEFIKPEFLVLIPVLYLLGIALKESAVKDKHIPWMLGGAGVALCLMWIFGSNAISGWQSVVMAFFCAVVQGSLTAGASVYVHQIVKQAGKEE